MGAPQNDATVVPEPTVTMRHCAFSKCSCTCWRWTSLGTVWPSGPPLYWAFMRTLALELAGSFRTIALNTSLSEDTCSAPSRSESEQLLVDSGADRTCLGLLLVHNGSRNLGEQIPLRTGPIACNNVATFRPDDSCLPCRRFFFWATV